MKDGVITGVVSSLFHPDREKPIVSFFLHARDKLAFLYGFWFAVKILGALTEN